MPAPASVVDLFVSYSRADEVQVLPIVRSLEAAGLVVFFDRDRLTAGAPWPLELESGLSHARAVAVFVGPGGLGEWQRREMYFALDRQVEARRTEREYPVIPVLLPNAEITAGFLFLNSWIDLRRPDPDGTALTALMGAVRASAAPGDRPILDVCPYRGLRAFQEEDAPFFFGREAATTAALDALMRGGLVIVAQSGFGKSSVLKAGVIPQLRRHRPPLPVWDVALFTPRESPWLGLAEALLPLLDPALTPARRADEAVTLARALASDRAVLPRTVDRILEQSRTNRLLVGIDQFEEVLTHVNAADREVFLDTVLRAGETCPMTLALTLRADFYGVALAASRPLADTLNRTQVGLGPVTEEELRSIIEGPAGLVGLRFEPGLVDAVLEDVQSHAAESQRSSGGLPLLEYTLTSLWEKRTNGLLTHHAYKATGGVAQSISSRAEAILNAQTADDQRATRQLFGRLVRVSGADEEGNDTRRRATREELGDRAWAAAERFAAPGQWLLTTGTDALSGAPTVEVAHEALIRHWRRLREWLKEDRDFLLWRQQLGFFLGPWRSTGALLAPELVPEATRWLGQRRNDLTASEREFIERSQEASTRRRRVPARVRRAALAVALVGSVIVGLVQFTQVHLAAGFGADDPLVVRRGSAWLSFLPWPGNRLAIDTGLHRDDVVDPRVLRLSSWDLHPDLGRMLLSDNVRGALQDNGERELLEFTVAPDVERRAAVISGALARELSPNDGNGMNELDLYCAEMLRIGGPRVIERVAADLNRMPVGAGIHFIRSLTHARAAGGAIDAAAQEAIGQALSRRELQFEAAQALAANLGYLPGPARDALPALIAALPPPDSLSPAMSSFAGPIARAIVDVTRAEPHMSNDATDVALASSLLFELQTFPTAQGESGLALGALIAANPAVIDRRITLPPDPTRKPRGSLTVYEYLRSDVAASSRAGFGPHATLMALGSIASVRKDLAPEIEKLLLNATMSDNFFEAPGESSVLEHFLRGRPERAAAVAAAIVRQLPTSTSNEPGRFLSGLKPQLVRGLTAAALVDRSLIPVVAPRLVALVRESGGFIDDAVGTGLTDIIRADPAVAPAVVDVLAANASPQGSAFGELLAAVVASGGAPVAHRLAPAVLTWSMAPSVNYGGTRRPAALTAVVHAAPDTCETMLVPVFMQLDQSSPSDSAQIALSEIANGDSHCGDRAMDMLLSRARRPGSGQSVTRYLYWASVIAVSSTYQVTDADWDAFTADEEKRDAAVRILAATLAHRADAAADAGQYLLEQLDGRSILTRRELNAIQSAAYRNAVSLAMAFFLAGSDARHETDRRQLRSQLETIAVSDARIPLRAAAVYALVEATRAYEERKTREVNEAAPSR